MDGFPLNIKLPDFGKVVEQVTTEVHARVVRRTPVDTGRAQGAWEKEVNGGQGSISNETPYIGYLENGTYKMAAFNMVRDTMEEVPDIIRKALENASKE